jgi:hypothetical protein
VPLTQLQERLAAVKINENKVQQERRKAIAKMKQDKEKIFTEKLNALEKERSLRKTKRAHLNLPERCTSSLTTTSMGSCASMQKNILIQSSSKLRQLQEELNRKKRGKDTVLKKSA